MKPASPSSSSLSSLSSSALSSSPSRAPHQQQQLQPTHGRCPRALRHLRDVIGVLLIASALPSRPSTLRHLAPALPPLLVLLSGFQAKRRARPLAQRLARLLPALAVTMLLGAPSPTLLPALFLLTLIHDGLLPLLPPPAVPAFFATTVLAVLSGISLARLPAPISLFDVALLPIALIYLPSYVAGVLLAHPSLARPRMRNPHVVFVSFAAAVATLVAMRVISASTAPALAAGALAVPLALLVRLLAARGTPRWIRFAAIAPSPLSVAAYVTAAPLHAALAAACVRAEASSRAAHLARVARVAVTLACRPLVPGLREPPLDPHWFSHPKESLARLFLRPPPLPSPSRVRPFVFFALLLPVALTAHHLLLHPLTRFLCMVADRSTFASADTRPRFPLPDRDRARVKRFARLFVYYVASATFLVSVFHLARPLTRPPPPPSLLCLLPPSLYDCRLHPDPTDALLRPPPGGLLAKLGLGSQYLTAVANVVRWLALLTLPTMLFNVFGHAIFPRAVWRPLPTIPQILSAGSRDLFTSSSSPFSTDFVLYFRYVTRGTHPRLVTENARRAAVVLAQSGLPSHMWRVEVVTDNPIHLDHQSINDELLHENESQRPGKHGQLDELHTPPYDVDMMDDTEYECQVAEIVVPGDYKPANGALYKARALNYAIEASSAHDHDWIVHLDEETRFDTDSVRAILDHCAREAYATHIARTQRWPRIGQGPIVYGRTLLEDERGTSGNWVTTLADSGRVSDDCGRYRLQYECGEVWVGMHGSFVVACNNVERAVTFDHGVEGSIAEDAFFAMMARSQEVRFAWIDGLMFEQSPFNVRDFIKQRSRWLVGGLRVVRSARIPWRLRMVMYMLTWLWAMMPVMYGALIGSILFGSADNGRGSGHVYYHWVLPCLGALSLWNYAFGFFVTFSGRQMGMARFVVTLYMQLLLSPVFGLMEVASVAYALTNYSRLSVGFHVVEKDGEGGDTAAAATTAHVDGKEEVDASTRRGDKGGGDKGGGGRGMSEIKVANERTPLL